MSSATEKMAFKAEVAEVLNLVVNSLYSHKEVFLRELISNAADAVDKRRFLALQQSESAAEPGKITLRVDKEKKILTIEDNGIGMSEAEVVENLGTIARSGTRAFMEQLKAQKESGAELIGQFGVGFYSAFMVASKVEVETLKAEEGSQAIRWESDAQTGYVIEPIEKKEAGTIIHLHLKEEEVEFLDEWKIKDVVKKYSDYVSYPVNLVAEKDKEEQINKVTAIWRRPRNEVKEEEYQEFYKYLSHDMEDSLVHGHYAMEGVLEYRALLFIPKKLPQQFYRDEKTGIKLHVKKMFITDDCKELLPAYLRFVRGVVDSEDLPLNVSREMLQQNPVVTKIQKQLTKKVLDLLEGLAKDDADKYNEFFQEFGVALKEGLAMDFENRDRLLKLLRYPTSKSNGALVSLDDYVSRMKEDQKEIFYVTGTGLEACQSSPHLEYFKKQDIEVLLMGEVIDEWSVPSIGQYQEKPLKSIAHGKLDDLDKEEKEEQKTAEKDLKLVVDRVRSSLQEEVKEVRLSMRLEESPSCLVVDEGDMGAQMEQIMKAMGKEFTPAKRILELNPNHTIVKNIQKALDANPKDERIQTWSSLLYHQALLREGTGVKDISSFVNEINSVFEKATES